MFVKRVLFVLLSIAAMGWVVGCATPEVSSEDGSSTAAMGGADEGPRKLDVKPGTLRMRAPAPAAAMRPRDRQPAPPDVRSEDPAQRPLPVAPVVSDQAYRLKKSDPIIVSFSGVPSPFTVEDIVDEQGMITLPYIGAVVAAERTSSELEKFIHDLYVPDYYRYMNVNVLMPTQRSYFVQGAVRGPGRHPFAAGMTLMRGISTAGGYTDFAQPKKVKLVREGKITEYNMYELQENPENDVPLEPGDQIIVPERIW